MDSNPVEARTYLVVGFNSRCMKQPGFLDVYKRQLYDGPGGSQSSFNFDSPVLIFPSPVLVLFSVPF